MILNSDVRSSEKYRIVAAMENPLHLKAATYNGFSRTIYVSLSEKKNCLTLARALLQRHMKASHRQILTQEKAVLGMTCS